MVGCVGWRVEVMNMQEWGDAIRDGPGCCRRLWNDGLNATEAQDAGAVRRLTVVLRDQPLLVGAAVRTADAIERVQGREQDEHRGGDEPSHTLIMHRFLCEAGRGARPCRTPACQAHEFDARLIVRVRDREESIPFRMVEPVGYDQREGAK